MNDIFKKLIKKKNKEILIDFKGYIKLNNDIKIALINKSIKLLRFNYYDIRTKKVENLIKFLGKNSFKKSTLGGCIFARKGVNISLKLEKT